MKYIFSFLKIHSLLTYYKTVRVFSIVIAFITFCHDQRKNICHWANITMEKQSHQNTMLYNVILMKPIITARISPIWVWRVIIISSPKLKLNIHVVDCGPESVQVETSNWENMDKRDVWCLVAGTDCSTALLRTIIMIIAARNVVMGPACSMLNN